MIRRNLCSWLIFALSIAAALDQTASASEAKRISPQPHVLRHAVRVQRWNAPARMSAGSAAYAGAVSTIPSILEAPTGVAFDPDDGNAYVLDARLSAGLTVVAQITPSGSTRLFATLPVSNAQRIAYDRAAKTFFVTYTQSQSLNAPGILSVSQKGTVAFIAGGGPAGQQDGTGAAASFSNSLNGITVDTKNGSLYVDDGDRIRAVTPTGIVTTLTQPGAIGGQFPYAVGGGVAYSAFDDALYVADTAVDSIKRIPVSTGSVTVLAGQCLSASAFGQCDPLQRDGQGPSGLFGSPSDIVVDAQTKLVYIADSANASIRRIDAAGNVSTLAGNGVAAHLDGAGQSAEFTDPATLMLDPSNHLLAVVDVQNSSGTTLPAIRLIRTAGAAAPPANTPITLFNPVSLDPTLRGINWLHTTHPPATLVYDASTLNGGVIGQTSAAGVSSEQSDPFANAGFGGGPFDVRYAFDGTQWVFESSDQLAHRSLSGALTPVTIGSGNAYSGNPGQLAAAPNGNMWFVIPQTAVVGQVTPGGAVAAYVLPSLQNSYSASIAITSSGTPWVATNNQLLELGSGGSVLIDDYFSVRAMTTGPDGNIWFAQSDAIGTIRPDNTILLYPIIAPIPGCAPGSCSRNISAIATGSDGALWVTENGAVAQLTTGGVFSEFPVLAARTAPSAISPGPDGNIWFLDAGAKKIGRMKIH